jgi:hypothetical protein
MSIILTDQMVVDATNVAKALHASFMRVLDHPNIQGRRAATLSTELGVGRMTCQRIAKLSKQGDAPPGPRLLADLPGVNGLRQFLDALMARGVAETVLADAFKAVDAFDAFLREIELSQTAFGSALLLHQTATDPEPLRQRRSRLFEAASTLTGQAADTTISMMALLPKNDPDHNFEQIAVRGYSGMRASGSAMPIRLPINMAYADYRNITGEEAAREPQALIESFCSTPLPSIDTRVIKEQHLAHLVNPAHIPTGEPFDCFATQHNRWNVTGNARHKAIWLYVDYPTRHCTFDLYVPHGLEQSNTVSGDCHLWGTSLLAPPEDLWMTRFADQIQFTRLGPGTDGAGSAAYARHRELTEHMFEQHGWDAGNFVGFRCEMVMPVWRSGMCIILDSK